MWFDCVLIDRVFYSGQITSFHIRGGSPLSTEKLENIDISEPSHDAIDVGPLRVFEEGQIHASPITYRSRNVLSSLDDFYVQLDHFGIPVMAGYYACVFPQGWRLVEVNVYDPYSRNDNPANNRSYRDVELTWDAHHHFSCVQFEMLSPTRGTFSLGVIAHLKREDARAAFLENDRPLSIVFSDPRHDGAPLSEEFARSTNRVLDEAVKMPGITVGANATGPNVSLNLVEWGRYLGQKVRRPPK